VLALLVAVLLGSFAAGVAGRSMYKSVTIALDGQERTVRTFARDVQGAVRAAGLTVGPRDRLEPDAGVGVADGDYIVLNRARELTLIDGGATRRVWTTASSVKEALYGLGLGSSYGTATGPGRTPRTSDLTTSVPADAEIPLTGMSLRVSLSRTVTLIDGAKPPRKVVTKAGNVAALLDGLRAPLGPEDVTVPDPETPLEDGDRVQVVRNGGGEVTVVQRIPPPVRTIADPKLAKGEKDIRDPGRAGEMTAVYRVRVRGGKEVSRERIRGALSTMPQARIVAVGTNPNPSRTPKSSLGAIWDRLARCESTGNWHINTGNGYYGGIQFDARTWRAYGGTDFAALPHLASREEQIAIAQKVRAERGGFGAWPACSRKLGLPGDER
jgi:uncharacterized protein YabE (DUF348 family)